MEFLKINDVWKAYSGHQALKGISLSVPRQSIFGLLGPNGAGKTTLIRIINQIINQDRGEIILNGHPISPEDVRRVGYLPEERGLYKKMKVGEQLVFLGGLKGLNKIEAKKNIKFWFDKLEITGWYDKKMEDLSKGMSQKVQFIATVLHNPELIILDEPFSGFDPVNANLIRDNILELKEKGATIIFSTHRMETVEELCDHIAMIHRSEKILDGSKEEIKEKYKTNTYIIEHVGHLSSKSGEYEITSSHQQGKFTKSEIKVLDMSSPNNLLAQLMPQAQIHHFSEKVPTMNDIFIEKVKKGGNHE